MILNESIGWETVGTTVNVWFPNENVLRIFGSLKKFMTKISPTISRRRIRKEESRYKFLFSPGRKIPCTQSIYSGRDEP